MTYDIKIATLLMLILMFISCERSIDLSFEENELQFLVVETILTDELKEHEIKLSLSTNDINAPAPPVQDASVSVRAGNTTYNFVHDHNIPGIYRSLTPFEVVALLDYNLEINWNGNTFQAVNQLASVAPLEQLNFSRYEMSDSFELTDEIVPLLSTSQQAMYQIDLDWSHIIPAGINTSRSFYYTFTNLHNSEFIRPVEAKIVFPSGTQAIITKYGIDDQYAEFLQATAIEYNWAGGFFYGYPENQVSNISGGALGYFATCAIQRDTLVL